ncbi:hypothetical protein SAMN05444166_2837 [Singulisphaera sp. GP187]|nr:hypothetical protein SAMN05444166_2837 [Singulisphaera sp. GP187]
MVLRLILVGLVIGLGLSMPPRRDLDTLSRSAQHWVNDRLAEWDPQTTSDQGVYVLVDDPAETSLPLSAPALTLVSDEEFAGVVDDSVALFAQDVLAATTREMDQLVKSSDQLAVSDPSKSLAIDLPTEPAALQSEEANPLDLIELVFEGWAEAMPLSMPVEWVEANESNPLDLAFEELIETTVTQFDQDASALAALTLEIHQDRDPGEAAALDRSSDGNEAATVATVATGRGENRLTNAVRLTREAVVAWASLIHGPAVVTISR